jgi:hypothetical protein
MLQNVAHGPLSIGLRLAHLFTGQTLEGSAERPDRLSEHIQRASIPEQI